MADRFARSILPVFLLTGCVLGPAGRFKPLPLTPAAVTSHGTRAFRVTRLDGTAVILYRLEIVADTLKGWNHPEETAFRSFRQLRVPLADIREIAVACRGLEECAGISPSDIGSLEAGRRVRVTVPSAGLSREPAVLVALSGEGATVELDRPRSRQGASGPLAPTLRRLTVPADSSFAMDVSVGRRSHVWEGAAIGGLVGMVVGGVWGYASQGTDCGQTTSSLGWCLTRDGAASIGAVLIGLPSAVVGGLLGAFLRTEIWAPVAPERLRVRMVPLPGGGVGVGGLLQF